VGNSIVRTLVPWLVALLGPQALAVAGIGEADLSAVLTVLIGAAYYVVVRLVESVWPSAGWLLGSAVQPEYPAKHAA
jgi:hypothetical protein